MMPKQIIKAWKEACKENVERLYKSGLCGQGPEKDYPYKFEYNGAIVTIKKLGENLDGSDNWWLPSGADSAINVGDYPHSEKVKDLPKIVCECGTDVVGYGKHSDWCPKAKLEQI